MREPQPIKPEFSGDGTAFWGDVIPAAYFQFAGGDLRKLLPVDNPGRFLLYLVNEPGIPFKKGDYPRRPERGLSVTPSGEAGSITRIGSLGASIRPALFDLLIFQQTT